MNDDAGFEKLRQKCNLMISTILFRNAMTASICLISRSRIAAKASRIFHDWVFATLANV
jgi:hypothetical protein